MNNILQASYNYAKSCVEVHYDIEEWDTFYLGWSNEPVSSYAQVCSQNDFIVMYEPRGLWYDPAPLEAGETRYYYAVDIYSYELLAYAVVKRGMDVPSNI